MKRVLVLSFVMLLFMSQVVSSNSDIDVDKSIFRSFAFVTDEPDHSLLERVLGNNNESLKELAKLTKNDKFLVSQMQVDEILNSWSEYDSIAISYSDIQQNERLQNLFQTAIDQDKMVYVYGEISLEDFYQLTDNKIYMSILSEDDEEKTFYVTDDANYKKKNSSIKKESTIRFEENINIIGMSSNPNAQQKLVLTNINTYDKSLKIISPLQETYFTTLLEHELDEINKQTEMAHSYLPLYEKTSSSNSTNNIVIDSSSSVITAVANYLGTHNYGKHEIQWVLFRNTASVDPNWDFLYFEQRNRITNAAGTSKKQNVIQKLLYPTIDQIQTSQPGNTSSGPYTVNLGYPWGISLSFTINTEPKYTLNSDWSSNISEWTVTKSNLATVNEYPYFTAFKKHLTLSPSAGIRSETVTEFQTGSFINIVKVNASSYIDIDVVY